jgi:prophage antirepressor-like protein
LCGVEFRVVWIGGKPLAVATDLAKGLGYQDANDITRHVSDKNKSNPIQDRVVATGRPLTLLSKRGILEVFMAIRKEETKPFREAVLDLLEAIDEGRVRPRRCYLTMCAMAHKRSQ